MGAQHKYGRTYLLGYRPASAWQRDKVKTLEQITTEQMKHMGIEQVKQTKAVA